MADLNAGRALVSVLPDLKGFAAPLIAGVSAEVNKAGAAASKSFSTAFGSAFKGIGAGTLVASAGFVALGAAAVKGLTASVSAAASLGNELFDLQNQLGTTAEETSKLLFIGERLGIGVTQLSTAFGFFEKNLVNNTPKVQAYGLSLLDAEGNTKSFDVVLGEAADKFVALGGGIASTAFAMNVFGRGGRALIPILQLGAAGIKAMGDEAARLGLVFSQDQIDQAHKFAIAQAELGASFKGVAVSIGNALLPVLTVLLDHFTSAIGTFNKIPGPVKAVALSFVALTGALVGLGLLIKVVSASAASMRAVFASTAAAKVAEAVTIAGAVGVEAAAETAGAATIIAAETATAGAFAAAAAAIKASILSILPLLSGLALAFVGTGGVRTFGDETAAAMEQALRAAHDFGAGIITTADQVRTIENDIKKKLVSSFASGASSADDLAFAVNRINDSMANVPGWVDLSAKDLENLANKGKDAAGALLDTTHALGDVQQTASGLTVDIGGLTDAEAQSVVAAEEAAHVQAFVAEAMRQTTFATASLGTAIAGMSGKLGVFRGVLSAMGVDVRQFFADFTAAAVTGPAAMGVFVQGIRDKAAEVGAALAPATQIFNDVISKLQSNAKLGAAGIVKAFADGAKAATKGLVDVKAVLAKFPADIAGTLLQLPPAMLHTLAGLGPQATASITKSIRSMNTVAKAEGKAIGDTLANAIIAALNIILVRAGLPPIPVDADTGPAHEKVRRWVDETNHSKGTVTADANITPAEQRKNQLIGDINAAHGTVSVDAATGAARSAVSGLVSWVNSQHATLSVSAGLPHGLAAEGGTFRVPGFATGSTFMGPSGLFVAGEGSYPTPLGTGAEIVSNRGIEPLSANHLQTIAGYIAKEIGNGGRQAKRREPIVVNVMLDRRVLARAVADQALWDE